MPIRKATKINLLPQDDFASSTFGRVLKWALSSFRVMVIVTELVVMSAFLSRFWLDARNSDLNEELNVNKAQVKAFSTIETSIRNYQKKLNIVKNLYDEQNNSDLVASVTQALPEDVTLTLIQTTGEDILIKANSLSERSIAQFMVNLSSDQNIKSINLSQVASSVDNSFVITFAISAKYQKNKITN